MAAVPVPVPAPVPVHGSTGSGYIQLYGPAAANFAATLGVFFYLRSQINSIKVGECKHDPEAQDAIMARLDKIEETMQKLADGLNNVHRGVVGHQNVLIGAGLITPPQGQGPPGDEGDRPPAKPKPKGAAPKKAAPKPPAKKAPGKASPKPKAKPQPKTPATETEIEDELDNILAEEEPDFDLETEAVEEPEPPKPKATPKGAAKKSFKKE